jgi:galactose mutarotase-like enzyme
MNEQLKDFNPVVLSNSRGSEAVILPSLGAWLYSCRLPCGTLGPPREILHADESLPGIWPARIHCGSPVLFPQAGPCMLDGTAEAWALNGNTYSMKQHGFARRMAWSVICRENDFCTMELRQTPETMVQYPFEFRLELTYLLKGDRLAWTFMVANDSERPMPFSAGFHPFFRIPMQDGGERSDCEVHYPSGRLGTQDPSIEKWKLEPSPSGWHSVDADLSGSVMITDIPEGSTMLSVRDPRAGCQVNLDFSGAPGCRTAVIWASDSKVPYVCAEPWTALPNALNSGDALITLAPGESWTGLFHLELVPI